MGRRAVSFLTTWGRALSNRGRLALGEWRTRPSRQRILTSNFFSKSRMCVIPIFVGRFELANEEARGGKRRAKEGGRDSLHNRRRVRQNFLFESAVTH
jgi:hypothetical protein